MEVLNVKVGKETKKKLERLVKVRGYKNMSEALRKVIEEYLEEHRELFAGAALEDDIKQAGMMSDLEFDQLVAKIFGGPRTAAELVGAGRERS